MTSTKKFAKIPIFISEYHHDVLRYIRRCFGSKHLQLDPPPLLVHYDAHPDMVVPAISHILPRDNWNQLLDEVSIENWIIPMCVAGLLRHVIWIKQDWAQQIPCGEHTFNVGGHPETGLLAVDSPLEYYVGEGSVVCSRSGIELTDKRKIKLSVSDVNDLPPTLETGDHWILDIDLDFFSTNNPFWAIYKKAGMYAQLRDIYRFAMDEKRLHETIRKRQEQLAYLKSLWQHLEENHSLEGFAGDRDNECFGKVEHLVDVLEKHYDLKTVDFLLIHDAGCTWDEFGLPDHRSTDEEIKGAVKKISETLRTLPDPVIITISRSSEDDYCPPDQVDHIQESVLCMLMEVYGDRLNSNPIKYYETASLNG